jgi:hypothetical protein
MQQLSVAREFFDLQIASGILGFHIENHGTAAHEELAIVD